MAELDRTIPGKRAEKIREKDENMAENGSELWQWGRQNLGPSDRRPN